MTALVCAQPTARQLHENLAGRDGFGKVGLPTVRKAAGKLTKKGVQLRFATTEYVDEAGHGVADKENASVLDDAGRRSEMSQLLNAVWSRW